jgi:uncharacterized phiE125 gp8 family phage protein
MSKIVYSLVNEQPELEPVTLENVKGHLEYYGSLKDSYIAGLITTARRSCEVYAGLSLVTQERSIKLDRFPCSRYENGWKSYIEVPYGPVQYITSLTYTNNDDTTTVLTEGTDFELDLSEKLAKVYAIDSEGNKTSWPSDVKNVVSPIELIYTAGYDDVSGQPVPAQAKTGIYRIVARLFEDRGDAGTEIMDWGTQTILDEIKVTWNADSY